MTRVRNVSASVLARLLDRARRTGDDYQTLLTAYACERFLYRLSECYLADCYVLKGAMLLRVWSEQPYRATRDLDLLRTGDGGRSLRDEVATICETAVEADGVTFDLSSIRVDPIREADEYAGTRVSLQARCGTARIAVQVDVGVADSVWPAPKAIHFPTLLDFPAPQIRAYAPETVVAEKLEAMVVLGDRNSRIKDFFDLRFLASHFRFDRETLTYAVRQTFERRNTPIPAEAPIALTNEYWTTHARAQQIRAFARRARLDVDVNAGDEIIVVLRSFLTPILDDLRRPESTSGTWPPGGPWR